MRKSWLFLALALGAFSACSSFAEAPHSIAGFTLGENIEKYRDQLRMETALPMRYMEYLTDVEVGDMEGFKSGYIRYGTCSSPGRIVRIKMKYAYPDREFYDKLLERLKEKFGKPSEWRGDPFHVYVAWKWSFKDKDNNKISMILQHYEGGDDEETPGNSLKMTMTNLVEEEQACYRKSHPEPEHEEESRKKEYPKSEAEFERFIPY